MANEKLYIPDKLKVGFQKRDGTFTGKLAYVIYFDSKGVLRKEVSWNQWRDKKISVMEIPNEPMEGFVLNRNVGGYKSDWNYRSAYIRVYDPRNFEIEIDLPNLLFILKEGDCSRGKGLEGKFVYAWQGTNLVLLPVACEDYRKSKNFTELQSKAVKGKELILGGFYTTKKQENYIYLGRFDYHWLPSARHEESQATSAKVAKRYVFWNESFVSYDKKTHGCFVYCDTLKNVACLVSDQVAQNYAELVEKYKLSVHGSKVVKFILKSEKSQGKCNWHREENGVVTQFVSNVKHGSSNVIVSICSGMKYYFVDGVMHEQPNLGISYPPDKPISYYNNGYDDHYRNRLFNIVPWVEPTDMRLYVELESGSVIKLEFGTLMKD